MEMKVEDNTNPSDRAHEEISVDASKQTTATMNEVLLWEAT
jgi:hypothetical protein